MILSALRAMLPAEIAAIAGPLARFDGPLYPAEQAAVARAIPKRVAEFTAGRVAARRALAQIGCPAEALPKGPGGAPVWPAGTTGSISHGGGMVAALAAPLSDIGALGVDLEPLSQRADPLADAICAPDEAARAQAWPFGLLRVFSAKEAAFKALYPRAGRLFGFDTLEITLADRGFAARLTRPLGPIRAGTIVAGGQTVVDGFIVTALAQRHELWRD